MIVKHRNTLLFFSSFYFLYYGTTAFSMIYLPILLKNKSLHPGEIGTLLSIAPIVSLFAQPFWGWLSDSIGGVKKIALLCMAGLTFGLGILILSDSSLGLYMSLIIFMFFSCSVVPLTDSWNMTLSAQHGYTFGSLRVWGSLGFAVVAPMMGWMALEFGTIGLYGLFSASILLAMAVLLPIADEKRQNPGKVDLLVQLRALKRPAIWMILLPLFVLGTAGRAVDSFISIYMTQSGLSELFVGLSWTLAALSEIPFFYFVSRWIEKKGPILILAAATAVYAVRWFLLFMFSGSGIFLAVQLLQGGSYALMYVGAMTYLRSQFPENLRTTAQMMTSVWLFSLPGIFGNGLGGIMYQAAPRALFLWAFAFACAAFILLLLFSRYQRRLLREEVVEYNRINSH